jgi:CubicO group peptidase (beta-lactamase class C family)
MTSTGSTPALCAVAAILACCSARDEPVSGPLLARDAVLAAMAEAKVPGLAIATLEDCQVERLSYYGVEDVGTETPVSERTVFEAASLSKPVTAWITHRLVDEGVLTLDERVAATLPFPRAADRMAYAEVTPSMLLSHGSGLPNWAGSARDPERTDPVDFAFAPGSGFRYSGEGYGLLQAFIEEKSGEELQDLFTEHLGDIMPDANFTGLLGEGLRGAYGHDENGLADQGRPLGDLGFAHGAASLRTPLADYARFAGKLCRGEGLSRPSHDRLIEAGNPVDPEAYGGAIPEGRLFWGHGIGRQELEGETLVFHWGDNGAFKAFVAVSPRSGRGIVYFANGQNGLQLIRTLSEPVVGDVGPIVAWLDYGEV